MSGVVMVVGNGQLSDFVREELSALFRVVSQNDLATDVQEAVDLALVIHDTWYPSIHQRAEEVFQLAGISWMRSFVAFGEATVGPLVRPRTSGCSQCAQKRCLMAGRDREEMWELQQRLLYGEAMVRDAWASRTGLLQVTHLIVAEAQRVLQGHKAQLENSVFLINLKTLKGSRHFFLPDPLCPVCGQLPDDSPTAAEIILQPSPKVSADTYRCRSMGELQEVLVKDYLDSRTGFFNTRTKHLVPPFAVVSVNLPLLSGDEISAGRTHSYAESELTAILEGLERYGGDAPRGKRTVIHDSFRNLKGHALDPVQVGGHTKQQYDTPDFPFNRFDPDRGIDWVWGYSFLRERPILVPEVLAYMSCGDACVYETSNGCALGGSLVEAIFYGILEVVERDAFLLTWYAKLPLSRLDLGSANDLELQLMDERLRAVAGYDLYFFNATMENGIPTVWGLAKNRKQTGLNLICVAGAHPDPVRAVKGAVHELADMMLTRDEEFEAGQEEYLRMYHDPFQVRKMAHHAMLYGLPQAEERLRFLLDDNRPQKTFDEAFKPTAQHIDLMDDLNEILQIFRRLNLDVIVVDQTTPEMRRNGLHCVKVFVPGMLPMTFGYRFTRLEGLERVFRVPVELGYAKKPLTAKQLNLHPHPFP